MAILEKEVWVTLNSKTIDYYEDLGYIIPREKNIWGRNTVPRGTKLLIDIKHLQNGSDVKVTKICDICGKHIPNQSYERICRREKEDGKHRCFDCGRCFSGTQRKNNIRYENSLEFWAKVNNREYLIEEWSKENNKKTNEVSFGTGDIFLWNCLTCGSEYPTSVSNRTNRMSHCPYCSGHKVNHTNCLWNTHPHIARLLKNKQRGFEISYGSGNKEIFICGKCGFEHQKTLNYISIRDFSCSRCSDGISYPEKFMVSVLEQLEIEFKFHKKFNWSKNKEYDFYIPSLNCIIETHGVQHYKETNRGRSLKEEQENDKLKNRLAVENGIENYIVIDCRESELEWIKNNISLHNELNKLINTNNINWFNCHEFACDSFVKETCDLWNSGITSTSEIAKQINMARSTVCRYLKKGRDLGWCNYNENDAKINVALNMAKNNKRVVIQLDLDGVFIRKWESLGEAKSILKINNISATCSGKQKTAGGFKWMYKEDYEKYIEEQRKELVTT